MQQRLELALVLDVGAAAGAATEVQQDQIPRALIQLIIDQCCGEVSDVCVGEAHRTTTGATPGSWDAISPEAPPASRA
jgi:hypothetical protein